VDGDTLTFTVVAQPTHGLLTGTPPEVTYTPDADFHGEDRLTFEVSDGQARATATLRLTVRPVNDVPVAQPQVLSSELNPTALTLTATDADGDTLTFAIATPPEQGTLSGTPPEVTYTPPEGFRGTASFTFTATDSQGATSAPAPVTIRVGNSPPVVALTAHTLQPLEGEAVRFQVTAADANNDLLVFLWNFGDGATSEEKNPTHAFANEGSFEVVLTVTDGLDTVRQALVLRVLNVAPVVVPLEAPAQAEEGKALRFRAQATDSGAQDTFTFSWDFGDGSAPGAGAEATHTYADDGTYTVKVTVTDDAGAFTQQTREVQVANVAPVPEPLAAQAVKGGEELQVQLQATDAAGARDALTWRLLEGPGSITAEGLYRWTPEASTSGHFPVRAQVEDDGGGRSELVFHVTVTAAQQPPPLDGPPSDGGCGCTSGPQGAASTALLLVLAAFSSRRRKRAP
jgi:MYXO-CTERM domain-containing protein